MDKYFVYIIECKDHTLYCGIASNLEKRMEVHNSGKGAKYTRGRTPITLRYYEEVSSRSDALKRERKIKALTRDKKIKLIENFEKSKSL